MRNWNNVWEPAPHIHKQRFYSTYEELKQKVNGKIQAVKVSFYSTYEELKLN